MTFLTKQPYLMLAKINNFTVPTQTQRKWSLYGQTSNKLKYNEKIVENCYNYKISSKDNRRHFG